MPSDTRSRRHQNNRCDVTLSPRYQVMKITKFVANTASASLNVLRKTTVLCQNHAGFVGLDDAMLKHNPMFCQVNNDVREDFLITYTTSDGVPFNCRYNEYGWVILREFVPSPLLPLFLVHIHVK